MRARWPACCWSTSAPASTCSCRRRRCCSPPAAARPCTSYHTPSGDKSCDGLAMALRFGLPLRDMEMVQFHPTGLLAGPAHADDRHRAGGGAARRGRLPAGRRRRALHGPLRRARRARDARHRVARDRTPRCAPGARRRNGGVYLSMGHLGPDNVRRQFKGMVERCADCGFDLAGRQGRGGADRALHDGRRRVRARLHDGAAAGSSSPARIRAACTAPTGWAATASPTRRCSAASPATRWRRGSPRDGAWREPDAAALDAAVARAEAPFARKRADPGALEAIRERLYDVMWDDAGIVRDARGPRARRARARRASAPSSPRPASPDGERAFNLTWHDALNLANLIAVSQVDRPRGAGARGFARRALPLGFSGRPATSRRRRSCASGNATRARSRSRAGALHARRARRDAASGLRPDRVVAPAPFAPRDTIA